MSEESLVGLVEGCVDEVNFKVRLELELNLNIAVVVLDRVIVF